MREFDACVVIMVKYFVRVCVVLQHYKEISTAS
jgi:hypothetical protein